MDDDIGGVWRTIGGRRVFIKDGEDVATAMKKSGKFQNENKKQELEKKLDEGLDDLEFNDIYKIYQNTKDAEIRESLMNKMQEKDPYRYGKEIYGIEMKEIDYKGTFENAIKEVDKINSNKEYITEKLYHGTNATFEKFSYDNFGKTDKGDFGQGIYLSDDKKIAEKYGKNVKEVEVKYKNPLIIKNDKDFESFYKKYGDEFGEAKQMYTSKQIAVSIMKMGYDAVIDKVYGQTIIYNLDNTTIKK